MDGDNRSWNLRFHRDFQDWELEAAFSFLHHIYSLGGCVSNWGPLGHARVFASLLFGWRNWFGKQGSDVWNLVVDTGLFDVCCLKGAEL